VAGPGVARIGAEEIEHVVEVLRSRQLSRYRFDDQTTASASKVWQFEQALSELTGARHCLGTNSCTSALLIGLLAAGIGPGDEVILPGYTFIAPIAAVVHTGAEPVLCEIDQALQLDPADVERRITPRTAAIVAVHMLGAPCNLDGLARVAGEHGLPLIEDCAQSGGGSYHGRRLGTFGLFGAFSLNVFKTFTAGDGGVLLTDASDLYRTAFALHDHGAAPLRLGVTEGPPLFGLNLRMHELTGAVALPQLGKLDATLELLRANRDRLAGAIGTCDGVVPRALHDPAGDCATVLAYTFRSPALAGDVSARLGTVTLDRSGKHNYGNMAALNEASRAGSGSAAGVPACARTRRSYPLGTLPVTDDLLSRTIALSVGVVDSYLGTSVGIGPDADLQAIEEMATRFRRAVAEARSGGR
jgi:dTDP-4-amino-4,6-dideoxygalactose transaminase